MNELQIVSNVTGISLDEIIGKKRSAKIAGARQLSMYMLHLKGLSFHKCANILNCDHSTVFHGVKRINELISVHDKQTCKYIKLIKNELYPFVYEI